MYTKQEVEELARQMAVRRRVSTRYLGFQVDNVMKRKRNRPFTAKDAAMVVVERCAQSVRRLGHDTGAENWY